MARLDPDAILKLSLAAAALMAGAGVGGYYGFIRPAREARIEAAETAAKQVLEQRRNKARLAAARQQQARAVAQADCRNLAELAYRGRWNAACRAQAIADAAALDDCRDDWFRSEQGCRADHPVRPSRDCTLPPEVAASLGADRARRQNQCLAEFSAEPGTTAP